jgi:hypothetical protein
MTKKYARACLVLWILTLAAAAWAQVYSGSLTGVVKDPSGGMVPGAAVKLTDTNKGYSYSAKTDDSGRYLLRSLLPGTYTIVAASPGFKLSQREGIVLNVNENTNLDIVLEVGQTQDIVDVVGSAPLLSTQDAVRGQTLNRDFVNDLPLLGRHVNDLARLSPGVTRAAGQGYGSEVDNNFVVNGQRNSTAEIIVEGVSFSTAGQHGGINAVLDVPDVDAVQEFKVQSSFSADVTGFSGSSVINMVIRSGTNSFHGSAWEFFRNDKLAANDWFANRNGRNRPSIRFNQFGGTAGGPIRKNKTFFFADAEAILTKDPATATVGVPSAAMRTGNFAEICTTGFDSAGMCSTAAGQLWDPFSGVFDAQLGGPVRSAYIPFNNLTTYQSPGNPKLNGTPYQPAARPGNLIDPVAAKVMQLYPLPNANVRTAAYNRYSNYFTSYSSPTSRKQYGVKIDHYFSEKDRLSARVAPRFQTQKTKNLYGNAMDPNGQGLKTWNAYSHALNYVHTFGPKTLITISLGYIINPVYSGRGVLVSDFPEFDISKDLGFPEYMKRSGIRWAPALNASNYSTAGGTSIGSRNGGLFKQTAETHDLNTSLSRVAGHHDLKFGWNGRVHRLSFLQPGAPAGNFSFSFTSTSQLPTTGGGDAMASMLMGVPTGGSYEIPARPASQSFQHGAYIQDNWRVTPKLTLNLGLRYDLSVARTERFNHMNYLDPGVQSPLQVPGLSNLHGGLIFASARDRQVNGMDYRNFGPRFGFAYALDSKLVLRGGYGIFYDPPRNGAAGTVATGFQGFSQVTQLIGTYQGDGATPWVRLSDPFPGGGPNLPIFDSQGLLSFTGDSVRAPFRSVHPTPYEQSWNFGLQRQVPGGIVIDASYVGLKGTHLYFGGAQEFNRMPEITGYSADQITALNQFVPNPFLGIFKTGALSGPTIPRYQTLLPYPQFTSFAIDELPAANSSYHSFQLRAEKRMAHGVQFLVTYTLSKSIDTSSVQGLTSFTGGSSQLQNPNNRSLERSLSQYDATHVLNVSYVWDLPIGRGKAVGRGWNSVLNGVLGGWKTNAIWQFVSGQPLGLRLSGGQSLPTYGAQRPNLVGTLDKGSGSNSDLVNQYFGNPQVVVKPAPFALGTAPRTLPNLRGPGIGIANLSIFKEFSLNKIREGMRFEYRTEAFNALNHPHFCGPNTTLNGGSFGVITGMCSAARELQLGMKLYF